ncbi:MULTISPECIES: TetM/TetW/TetO/TetS family tetracycline resistance ribosomal protection protein [unclassified Rhizobium]|jgi:ribosomal protection tetracycline resistance protein|uniref:elongation factor G n=1 Tax=unclassified Rhizobium TaxID=2613769 RepID=UPI000647B4AE|nr:MULTISPECIES: TetM/TetW/TetO/TetS family tetracycline resistance ribosomal protection protein [unclassified Rhizobium]MBN8949460.1 TetM/TetW/TetO/TetS family tetracycline resistance ribosomal protection protein [Rhizobium tropici]OJY75249.1 MAG: GTP-binding protein [Rhizobium sp. 60-20]RKD70756.1 ribosomal protection tetracycline resistance protein [Rhizobium sp. WW_1]
MRTLNLGILAHVDAGKTSLTERLLFDTGIIDKLGSVDAGSTQTDSLELERQRGITIAAAVVSFTIGDVMVNLIDTPGHPDFIAEIERILQLLDAAVVVVSAVEGVQPQTRVLVRALRRLGIPFLFFINKVDRLGARYDDLLEDIATQLAVRPVAMSITHDAGSRLATVEAADIGSDPHFSRLCETLSVNDEDLLEDYVLAPKRLTRQRLDQSLADQVAKSQIHPAFAGAATRGLGISALISAIETLLPSRHPDPDRPVSGTIFKIERGWGGEKLAYLYLASGTIGLRDDIEAANGPAKISSLQLFRDGRADKVAQMSAGQIAKVGGLANARIGDWIGIERPPGTLRHFAPPTLETCIRAMRPSENAALWLALGQLAEQDPLINLRANEETGDIYVSLYGEVQKEVIQATLSAEFGLDIAFEESTVIYVERLAGTGSAVELIFKEPNPFLATVGLRVEPRPEGAGNSFALEVDIGQMPASFYRAVEETAFETLKEGVLGWQIIDCHVAMTAARQTSPASTAVDFRKLTPLVLATALSSAETILCEPIEHFHIEIPATALAGMHSLLAKSGASMRKSLIDEGLARLEGMMASSMIQVIQRQLPGLSGGAGVLDHVFDHYAPLNGQPHRRARASANPFDRADYLRRMR